MKKTSFRRTLAVILAVFSSVAAMGQQTKGETDWMKELSSRITLNGYAQAGYSWQDANGKQVNDFNLKRTLLWAKAKITDRWSFLFMHDFSSVVQEFYTDYRITNDNALTFRIGQFKNSFSLENPLSPTVLELIDVCSQGVTYLAGCGSDPLHGKNYGRDLGAMVMGDVLNNKLHYEFAVMNGQGINKRDGNNNKDLIAKLELRPIDGLRLVVSGQKGKGHAIGTAAWNPEIKEGDDYRRDRYSVGAEYKMGSFAPGKYKEARPLSIRGEWLGGRDGKVDSRGGYLTACVPLTQGIDLVASYDYFDRNGKEYGWEQTNITAGLQYWFYKKCRMQLQYTRAIRGFQLGDDYNWLQAQMQVAF